MHGRRGSLTVRSSCEREKEQRTYDSEMSAGATPHRAIPILRVNDVGVSVTWYARLGFSEDWRHQHEPGLPWFVSVSTVDGATLFLTEHSGDASPGGSVYLVVKNIGHVAQACGTTPVQQPWGDQEFTVTDPDGNRVRVGEPGA